MFLSRQEWLDSTTSVEGVVIIKKKSTSEKVSHEVEMCACRG